ncbi:MAG: hypothetical protein WC307_01330 [Candidatus Nanoarchaeia archaeon]|jgi:NDP-sugar pyrophosphorylase family protein
MIVNNIIIMELFDLAGFKFPELVQEPLFFQSKLHEFFDKAPVGYKIIRSDGELINNSFIKGVVYLGVGAVIKPFSYIEGRLLLDDNSSLGPHAFIRGDVIVGSGSELRRCEVKDSILLTKVKAHHHSYIGDSIIGNRVNIAAGFIIANLRFDNQSVKVKGFGLSPTRKFGALIGDDAKTMINACLMPGSVVEKGGVVKQGVSNPLERGMCPLSGETMINACLMPGSVVEKGGVVRG